MTRTRDGETLTKLYVDHHKPKNTSPHSAVYAQLKYRIKPKNEHKTPQSTVKPSPNWEMASKSIGD